ncbi:hypothetical protein BGZ80_006936 [Entomortierella chlamydospora]|uniref:Uncharacterized protein n=1 Tax=Entomortierella chlamydospora TaxID=101097 RepID=A0A9P6MZX2_9FUNG|nr:hypothetical protein BGZ80_006936 [Entomortierella chlamydospora]
MSRSTTFPSHVQLLMIRHEASLRKQALSTFGPQGVLDLALLGAILGNNIREIGRYKVTCDGNLVQGRYTIYELVHFGALSVTGRCRERQPKAGPFYGERRSSVASNSTAMSVASSGTSNSSRNTLPHIYPTTLANIFPTMVFTALRKKSIRSPKFQHDDSASCTPVSSAFHFENTSAPSTHQEYSETSTASTKDTLSPIDPVLITNEAVLLSLVQQKLHRVKDLPLPRELCFLGAVSLPLPPVLRAMHIAWTIDFLKNRATSARRLRQQLKPTTMTDGNEKPTGGLGFRPDIYAYKMRVARLARAQLQHSRTSSRTEAERHEGVVDSVSMRRGPSSTSIIEENEDEDGNESDDVPSGAAPPRNIPPKTTSSSSETNKLIRQEKRMMQQLLSLENKVPRIVRQWATAARSCFAEELIQEDRQVQEWVDRQRIQVVLACGYRFGSSSATNSSSFSQRRPTLSPISTTLANSLANSGYGGSIHQRASPSPSYTNAKVSPHPLSHPPLSGSRESFPEGVRLGSSPGKAGAIFGVVEKLKAEKRRNDKSLEYQSADVEHASLA